MVHKERTSIHAIAKEATVGQGTDIILGTVTGIQSIMPPMLGVPWSRVHLCKRKRPAVGLGSG